MRATASHDTVLDGVFVPDELTPVVTPAGFAGAELFHLAILAWALLGFANVYAGVAHRAYDLTVAQVTSRRTIGLTRTMAYHPEVQHSVADMRMSLEAIDAYLGRICDDWSHGIDHGADWGLKIMAAKHFAVTQAWSVVDTALDVSGGSRPLQAQPPGAALPRRSPRTGPSRQPCDHLRGHRQAVPRHRPRRAAPLGLSSAQTLHPTQPFLPTHRPDPRPYPRTRPLRIKESQP